MSKEAAFFWGVFCGADITVLVIGIIFTLAPMKGRKNRNVTP